MKRALRLACLITLATVAGCSTDQVSLSPSLTPAQLAGATQVGDRTIGPLTDTALGTNDQPLVVMVTDRDGVPVRGVDVTWAASNGGKVSEAVVPTDAGGESIVFFTYGPTAGYYTVVATVAGLAGSPITYTMRATAGNAVALAKAGGDNFTIAAGGKVVHTVVARDANGNRCRGVWIAWATGTGGGSISFARSVTGPDGATSTTRTLGPGAGIQTVTATALDIPGSPQLTFSTIATAPAPVR